MKTVSLFLILTTGVLLAEEVCTENNVREAISAIQMCLYSNAIKQADVGCAIEFVRDNPIAACPSYRARCTAYIGRMGTEIYANGYKQRTSEIISSVCRPTPPPAPVTVPEPQEPTPPHNPYKPHHPKPHYPVKPPTGGTCASLGILECSRNSRCNLVGGSGAGIGPKGYRCCPRGGGSSLALCGPNMYP